MPEKTQSTNMLNVGWWKSLFDFSPVQSVEDARKTLREIGMAFYFISGLIAVVSLFLKYNSLYDALIYVAIGYSLHKCQSRTGAVFAVLVSCASIFVTGYNLVSTHPTGGRNIVLAIIVFAYALRAVKASIAYHRKLNTRLSIKNILVKNISALLYTVIFFFLSRFILSIAGVPVETWTEEKYGRYFLLVLFSSYWLTYAGLLPFSKHKPFAVVKMVPVEFVPGSKGTC